MKHIVAEEFASHFVKFPGKKWGDRECEAHGLSVAVSLGDAQLLQRRIPGMLKKQIAVAELDGTAGKVAQTGPLPNHYTWWPSEEFDMIGSFKIVEVA